MSEDRVEPDLNTEAREKEMKIAGYWTDKFKQSMVHKSSRTKEWYDFWDAYTGDYFTKKSKPDYKSDQISNFIFSTIETIRPIMVDNDPGFIAMARNEEGMKNNDKVQMALDYEFSREEMDIKIPRQTITSLVLGTSVWYIPWNGNKGDLEGEVEAIEINPFNFYQDPLATSVDDAEYLIYATYKHVNKLKELFPNKSNLLEGGDIKYEELIANRSSDDARVDNQVLVLEIWCRDHATMEFEEEDEEGRKYRVEKKKYPRGRVLTISPDFGVVLDDKENPYNDGKFPFVLIKDYDVPFEFWGDGEPKQLLSPQNYINDLSNQVIDNAKLTANQVWIMDKNSGIGYGKLTNRPGLVVRKNPGSNVERHSPPPMPGYVGDKIRELKADIETISGIHDATQGKRPTGIQAGNAIMALQEAGQARIRLKVKSMEQGLSKIANMWYNRMQQFWSLDRWVMVFDDKGEQTLEKITSEDLEFDFNIEITAGSTMPKNRSAMLETLISLAQTTAEDGLPMIDREAVLQYVDVRDKARVIKKMEDMKEDTSLTEEVIEQVEEVNMQLTEEVKMLGEEFSEAMEGTMEALDSITGALEDMRKDIDKLYSFHEEEEKEEEKEQLREEGREEMLDEFEAMMGVAGEQQEMDMSSIDMEGDMEETMEMDESLDPGMDLPDEFLELIMELSDEELQELLALQPELEEIIANNLNR